MRLILSYGTADFVSRGKYFCPTERIKPSHEVIPFISWDDFYQMEYIRMLTLIFSSSVCNSAIRMGKDYKGMPGGVLAGLAFSFL